MIFSTILRTAGWLMFGLALMAILVFIFSVIAMPAGSYSWDEMPPLAQYSILGAGAFAATAVVLFISSAIVGSITGRAILANGIEAQAVILQISDTGASINRDPVVRLLLEVHPPDAPAFQAEVEHTVPRLQIHMLQPGIKTLVKYDPQTKAVALMTG